MSLETIETLDTTPFKNMIMTVGNVPSSFVDSMSYYEMLSWLCQYITKEIIPVLNADSETIKVLEKEFTDLKNYVDAQIGEIPQLREDFVTFTNQVTAIIDAYKNDVEDYVDDQLVRFRTDIQLVLNQMNTALNTNLNTQIELINDKIDNMVIANVTVFNASLGEYQTLQETLDYLFNYQRTEALTAKEYDDLELTAKGYDDEEITAFDYDNFGKTILVGA